MTIRGRRLLSEEEIEVWLKVARSVVPRSGAVLPSRKPDPTPVAPLPQAATETRRTPPALPGYTPPVQRKPEQPPLAPLDKRYRQKVTRGRVDMDGAIDLHGLTQAEAHWALTGFLRSAQQRGSKLVLVVTGKGRARRVATDPHAEPGVLRRAVPLWLRAAELRGVVLGFEEAGLPHGGMGALYVRLRRRDG